MPELCRYHTKWRFRRANIFWMKFVRGAMRDAKVFDRVQSAKFETNNGDHISAQEAAFISGAL